jgi:iron complex transport system substrate-binding protein
MHHFPPRRIVCLTEETVETLYRLGEDARIVGVSGYAVRPPRVRREKPRVSAFISANTGKILALEPDLVLTFSDLQADIVAEFVRLGIAVHAFNQRDIAGIFAMIETLSALVGVPEKGMLLVQNLRARAEAAAARSIHLPRPRVYFEEWDEPMISGIGWVSELIALAGGDDIFPELAHKKSARERIVAPEAIIAAAPDIVIGSWCGKKFRPERLAARAGFAALPAVRDNFVREIKSTIILQPGPAALTDGLDAIEGIVSEWRAAKVRPLGEPIQRTG